jgi:curli biogenesis system outer membrane secretion channel CsgG
MMKKLTQLAGIILMLVMGLSLVFAQSGKMRIAVMDFENKSGYSGEWQLGQGMSSMLQTALFKTGKFDVYEREKLHLIMQEKKMALEGAAIQADASKLGAILGVDYIITGTVSEFGMNNFNVGGAGGGFHGFGGLGVKTQNARVVVDIRIIDVKTGQLVAAEQGEGKETAAGLTAGGGDWHSFGGIAFGSEGFDSTLPGKATRKAIANLVEKISGALYKAKIIDVSGNEVTINIGQASGIKKNQVMTVFNAGKALIDPDTGAVLGQKKEWAGEIKIVSVEEKYSTGVIVKGEGVIQPGNLVEKK